MSFLLHAFDSMGVSVVHTGGQDRPSLSIPMPLETVPGARFPPGKQYALRAAAMHFGLVGWLLSFCFCARTSVYVFCWQSLCEWSCHTGPSNLQGSSSTSISSAWALCHEFESPCYFSITLQSLPSLPGLNHYTKRPVTSKTKSLSESKYWFSPLNLLCLQTYIVTNRPGGEGVCSHLTVFWLLCCFWSVKSTKITFWLVKNSGWSWNIYI